MGGSSSSGELSEGLVSGEESELCARRAARLMHLVVIWVHSERDSWSV